MSKELVNDIFSRAVFDEVDISLHSFLYEKIKEIACLMDANAPESEEKTLAFRALHLALMHYGSALTKKYTYP